MKATNPIIKQRVEDVLRIRLDGAEGWDVRRYVAEKEAAGEAPWTVAEGGKPLSERQIRNYVTAADELINESCRQSRKKLLRRHLAQRRNLYARAVNKGDERTALAILDSEAKLRALFPNPDAESLAIIAKLTERLNAIESRQAKIGGTGQPDNRSGEAPSRGD